MLRSTTGTSAASSSRSTTSLRCATNVSDRMTTGLCDSSAALKAWMLTRNASSTPFG